MTTVSDVLRRRYPMNEQQRAIVAHTQGALRIIAGPGSGKTRSLLLLAMNLLLCGDAQPSEFILCTYTEKAGHEMRDRLLKIATDVGYQHDLAAMRIGTIHSICKQLITENAHYLPIEGNFVTLDQFTQRLLIFEEIDTLCTPAMKHFFQKRWTSHWDMASELGASFDKITEELIFEPLKEKYARVLFSACKAETDRLCANLTYAYLEYQKILAQRNALDFAHLQKCVYNLLCDPKTSPYLTKGIRYILVDEYQDTNYIQEQILGRLAAASGENNLFVVGDEDQALYRFRGATVRNILEFEQANPGSKTIPLMANYRSHHTIIEHCNRWITAICWENPQGTSFRTEKYPCPPPHREYEAYPAVSTMILPSMYDEAEQFAELVLLLKRWGKIQDYSQIALLLYSVKPEYSAPYIQALREKGIASFCPRAMSYFDHDEVRLLLGCFAYLLDFKEGTGTMGENDAFPSYLDACRERLKKAQLSSPHLQRLLLRLREEIAQLEQRPNEPGKPLQHYFYRLMMVQPFLQSFKGPDRPHHLEKVSGLLQMFQQYYRYEGITSWNREAMAHDFFQRFFLMLYRHGLNYDEASLQAFPQGQVPILTIHQAKGLEFPVVVVGRLDRIFASTDHQKHKALQELSLRKPFEPDARISSFDVHRLYYVAFSRAKSLLILMAVRGPGALLASLWQQIPVWSPDTIKNMPASDRWEEPVQPRPHYGFTSDLQLYSTCPRQYQFFRAYNFAHTQNTTYFSGQLVHSTLEHIHRIARDNKLETLNEETLAHIFERKFRALTQSYLSSIESGQKTRAWRQVLHYVQQNWEMLKHVEAAELPVQIEKSAYVLTGKIDLLIKTSSGTNLIDFKTQPRPKDASILLEQYEQQVHFYAHALEQAHHHRPERLFFYWTAEERKENALMEVPYQAEKMKKIGTHLENVVAHIEKKHFHVHQPPAIEICLKCDLRNLCQQDRVIDVQ